MIRQWPVSDTQYNSVEDDALFSHTASGQHDSFTSHYLWRKLFESNRCGDWLAGTSMCVAYFVACPAPSNSKRIHGTTLRISSLIRQPNCSIIHHIVGNVPCLMLVIYVNLLQHSFSIYVSYTLPPSTSWLPHLSLPQTNMIVGIPESCWMRK